MQYQKINDRPHALPKNHNMMVEIYINIWPMSISLCATRLEAQTECAPPNITIDPRQYTVGKELAIVEKAWEKINRQ